MDYLKNIILYSIPTAIKLLAGLFIVKAMAIYLGADGLGRLGQFMSLISIVVLLSGGGISTGIVKYVAQYKNDFETLAQYIKTGIFITLFCSLLFGCALYTFSSEISLYLMGTTIYTFEIKILSFAQLFIALGSFIMGILNGHRLVYEFAAINILTAVIGATGVIIGCSYYKISGAMYGLMWFSSCQVLFLVFWYLRSSGLPLGLLVPRFFPHIAKQLSFFSAMQLVTVLTMQSAQILIRVVIESKTSWLEVGYWQGLNRISDAYLQFITVLLASYYMPKLSEAKNKNEIKTEVISVYKIIIPLLFLLIPIFFVCRFYIIQILFTKEFYPIGDLFIYQITGDFFKVVAYVAAYVAVAKAAVKTFILAELFQATALLSMTYFFVGNYGFKGAVYSYLITYVVYAAVAILVLIRYLRRN